MKSGTTKPVRCAIYTRVSTDRGLEQDFNSLDAQHDAAKAYIRSQAHAGWTLIRSRYDDGGYSGGSTERPALQRVLADVRARKVDVIVVYKVDRLTRSLADFAKLVELFSRASRAHSEGTPRCRLRHGHPCCAKLRSVQLWSEQIFVILPQGHALCTRKEIEWEAVRDEHFILRHSDPGPAIQDYVIKRLADLGHRPSVQKFDVGRETSVHLVALGLGVSLTSEATIANCFPEVEFRPIGSGADTIPFSGVWSPKNDNPAFRRFLSLARVLAKKWSKRSDDVTTPALAGPTVHDLIGRSLVVLAASMQMLGQLT